MPNSATYVVRLSNFPPKLPNVPPNYPLGPAPGKLQELLVSNQHFLYHRFSPFTNYHDSILGGILSDKQPFVYTYIDQAQNSKFNQLPATVKGIADLVNINQDSIDDVVRVGKFLVSSWGVQFLINQTAIQRLASFDETRVFNPLSPILATVQPLTLGLGEMPTRHLEGGLLGLANSVTSTVGINLSSGFQTPQSTVGSGALPSINLGQGKGLIRGGDANSALLSLKQRWGATQSTGTNLGLAGLVSTIGSSFRQFFGGSPKSPGTYRADEQASDIMYNNKTLYQLQSGASVMFYWFQPWYVGNTGTRPGQMIRLWPSPQGLVNNIIVPIFQYDTIDNRSTATIPNDLGTNMAVGYPDPTTGGQYSDSVFPAKDQQYTNSDMLVNFAQYIKVDQDFATKLADPNNEQVVTLNKQLAYVVQNINQFSNTYNATSAVLSSLLPSGVVSKPDSLGYNKLTNVKDLNLNNGMNSARQEYKFGSPGAQPNVTIPKSVDETFKKVDGTSLRMATTFKSDGLNLLGVLPNNQTINDANVAAVYPDWTEWKPYDDDLVAFYFYDVVNSKFIPFRATVKGISEGNTAYWDELRFIGRSDQLYSYNGFSRTLSFTFNVVINSVRELLPSWKKINYLASAVKPSNYTTGQNVNQRFNRFIVPPMFMLTIGDLYKFQPMVITSINVNIPDDAAWETLNEVNAKQGWSYLNGLVTAPTIGKNYGQLPREVEIAITCNLLEKERAVVGGSHFGHEPRIDDWELSSSADRFLTSNDPYTSFLPAPTTLHQGFVEWNDPGTPNPVNPTTATTNQSINNSTAVNGSSTNTVASQQPVKLTSVPTTAGNILAAPSFATPNSSVTSTNNITTGNGTRLTL